MNRRAVVIPLIPVAPPCFEDRMSWVEFVVAADDAVKASERGPIDHRHPEPRFNRRWNFCADCMATHALAMQAQGRCHPRHLREVAMPEVAKC